MRDVFRTWREKWKTRRRQAALDRDLIAAIRRGDDGAAPSLLDAGATLNPTAGWPPLLEAVLADNIILTRYLLERGANPNAHDEEHQISALMYAAQEDRIEQVKLLLNMGVDVNALDWQGTSALAYADTAEMRRLLQRAGAKAYREGKIDSES